MPITARTTRTHRTAGTVFLAGAVALALTACGVTSATTTEATDEGPIQNLQVMIPNAPGSGYDVTGLSLIHI